MRLSLLKLCGTADRTPVPQPDSLTESALVQATVSD